MAKRKADLLAVRKAAISGDPRFFFGSDSAPHRMIDKEKAGGAAGIFNIPFAISCIAQVFEAEGALDNLEAFMSLNGPRFYSLAANLDSITLKREKSSIAVPEDISVGEDRVKVFSSPEPLFWQVVNGLRKSVNQN